MDINDARKKITEDSQKIGSSLATYVEEHLNSLCTTEEAVALVTAEGKTVAGCISSITEAARKKAVKGSACLGEDEVVDIIDDYYGLKDLERTKAKAPQDEDVIDIFDLI